MTRGASRSGELIGNKYRLERLLGQGGMGVVYAARNTATGKRVAIKCLHREVADNSEAAQRFMREAKASARVRHPNVVDVYDIVTEAGALYLVMELLDGEPLSSLMAGPATLLPDFIRLLIAAMRGVAAAHREGVIHRDIKPENIFLSREGDDAQLVPKVLDFGISKLYGTQDASLTAPGAALGTALYMSSEQLHGLRDLDARADVYAFGVILYQAVTGRAPFEADALPLLLLRIMTENPTPVLELRPDAPPKLSAIIEKAMARQRDERLPSLEAFIAGLAPFAEARRDQQQLTRPFAITPPSAATPGSSSEPITAPKVGPRRTPLPNIAVSTETPFAASAAVPRTPAARSLLTPWIVAACGLGLAVTSWWLLHDARSTSAMTPRTPAAVSGATNITNVTGTTTAPDPLGVPAPATPAPAQAHAALPAQPQPEPLVTPPATANEPASTGPANASPAEARQPAGNAQQTVAPRKAKPLVVQSKIIAAPRPPLPTKPSCHPNFTLDDQGEKHFKPECF